MQKLISLGLILVGLIVIYFVPRWQVRLHNKLIRENGSRDSLKKIFHHKWFVIRVFIFVITAFIIHIPVVDAHLIYMVRVICFTVLALAYFGYTFNPRLNIKRNLKEWYISRDPKASFTDRVIVTLADKRNVEPEWLAERLFLIGLIVTFALYTITYIQIK